ncbi:MAG TPA: tetraacyldisaccharide 4'-kinase [Bacteroidia bacterium]|nr:tetraacyldisaccharide 4'-kinase [Bacteroidia bacterium]
MKFLRFFLFPFALIYGGIIAIRNLFFDTGIFASTKASIPLISVGNLTTGGSGKTPHVEYLIRLLKNNFRVATLSRGYGRSSKSFFLATNDSTANDIGDEPMQFKNKFPEITVAVDEKRLNGIHQLLKINPELDVFLLDDAFQHRSVKPHLSILLSDYKKIFRDDYLLPIGNLRESKNGYKRADIIIITKCPETITIAEKENICSKIKPLSNQKIFFSFLKYGNIISLNNTETNVLNLETEILLVTGIANSLPLESYLNGKVKSIFPMRFRDHHTFTTNDIQQIKNNFELLKSQQKIILCTEKDAMRFLHSSLLKPLKKLPFYYIPIEIYFQEEDKKQFDKMVLQIVSKK